MFFQQDRGLVLACDVDNTLLITNVSFLFGRWLYRNGELSTVDVLKSLCVWLFHKIGVISTTTLHKILFRSIFSGREAERIGEMVKKMAEEASLPSLIRASLLEDIAYERQHNKCVTVVLLSNSPQFLLLPIARATGADIFLGTLYEVDDQGRYARVEEVMTGKKKASFIDGLKRDGWRVRAYTDSVRDLRMLLSASEKRCVAPTIWLRMVAWAQGWKILSS